MSESIVFRPLVLEDLAKLFVWLTRAHVARWYGKPPSSYAEVVARYASRAEPGSPIHAHVLLRGGLPVGYAQHYPVSQFPAYAELLGADSSTASMDLLVGDASLVGCGLGSQAIRRYVEDVVFADEGFAACAAGTPEGHEAARRAFARAGFQPWKRVEPIDGPAEQVLLRSRA